MEEIHRRILLVILGAIISGPLSGLVTGVRKERKHDEKIEQLAKESSAKESRIQILSNELSRLNYEYNSTLENFNSLQADYQDLSERYERCISSEGSITSIGSIDTQKFFKQFKTGDELGFELISSSLSVEIIRISDRGPLLSIRGCKNYVVEDDNRIETEYGTQYLLQIQTPLSIRFTSSSCEDDENIEPTQVEEVVLILRHFSVDEQTIQLEYYRRFLF